MKAKTRNYGVCALAAAVLLAMAMLVTGCPAEPGTETGYQPPAGMGAIQLKFGPIARATTLPDTADIDWFAIFGLEFQARGIINPGEGITEAFYSLADLTDPIDLEPGDYTLIVIGYATEDDGVGKGPAATDSIDFTIAVGTPINETVTLKAYDPEESTEDGLFAWKITNDISAIDPLESITMTVITIAGTPTSITNETLDLTTGLVNATGVALPAGFYYVVFSLTTEGGIEKEFRHVLHIYQNMTSTFTYTFNDKKLGIIESVETEEFKILDIEYEKLEDLPPEWSVSGATPETGTEDDPVILSSTVSSRVITVTNFTEYDSIEFYCDGVNLEDSIGGDDDNELTISTVNAPFDEIGVYQLIIVGIVGDEKAYDTEIFIEVK